MGYIERLSKEDIMLLTKVFLEIPADIVDIKRLPGSNGTEAAYIDFDDKSTLVINDYTLSLTRNLLHSPEWERNFIMFMTYSFGPSYIDNYAKLKFNIPYYEAEAEEALQTLKTKQKECAILVDRLEEDYNNFDFTSIFGGPIKL